MANDSAYNILGEFRDESLDNIKSGGFVEYSPIGEPGQKDSTNLEIATQDVQNEDYYDIMADYFAGDYLPVKEQGLLDFQQEYEATVRQASDELCMDGLEEIDHINAKADTILFRNKALETYMISVLNCDTYLSMLDKLSGDINCRIRGW